MNIHRLNYASLNVAWLNRVGESISESSEPKWEGESSLITFTVDGKEYQAEEGMTWENWIESSYNVNNFYGYDLDGEYFYVSIGEDPSPWIPTVYLLSENGVDAIKITEVVKNVDYDILNWMT